MLITLSEGKSLLGVHITLLKVGKDGLGCEVV